MRRRPECHKCKHKGILPGDAHIQCRHPKAQAGLDSNPIAAMAEAFLGGATDARIELGIVGGGQTWPANFNPAFLEACNGEEPLEPEPELEEPEPEHQAGPDKWARAVSGVDEDANRKLCRGLRRAWRSSEKCEGD